MKKKLAIIFFMFCVTVAYSQKVALVLSGGGAKGLAHTGVIKALEENGIPIDYIVGTSMGSIVGGFYAAGYSADELMRISLSQEMQNWVKGVIDENYNYYYTRKEPDARWLSAELSLDSVFNAYFNTNIAQDHALNFALAEYLAQASKKSGYDFDSLFVPYRAMAAEVFTQSEVMLRQGHLSDALRASMTVPFFFRPIRFDGKYLLDGGIYNNFPVDVAIREFNPDIIIGVNVSSKVFKEYPYGQDEKLINSQLLFLMLDKSDPELLEGNIYIEPNLDGLGSTDFARAQSIVDSGYVAAMRQMPFIREKIGRRVSEEELAAKRQAFTSAFKPLYFDQIEIAGFNKAQTSYLDKVLARKNQVTTLEEIKAGYFKIVSEDYFRSIYPKMSLNEETGFYKLHLSGSPSRKLRLALGGTMTSRSTSNLTVGAEYKRLGRNFTHYDISLTAGRFYQSAKTSMRMYFPFSKPFYFEPEYTYNSWDFANSTEVLLKDKPPTIVAQVDRAFRAGVSMPLGTYHKLTLTPGLFNNRNNYTNSGNVNTDDIADELRLSGFFGKLSISQNNLNYHQYPTRGEAFEAAAGAYSAIESYSPGTTSLMTEPLSNSHTWGSLLVSYQKNSRLNPVFGYGYQVTGFYSTLPNLSNYRGTILQSGGYFPLADSRTLVLENFRANKYIAGGLRSMVFITDQLHFRLEGHFFKPIEQLTENESQLTLKSTDLSTFFFAGSAGLVFHSPVGPIALSANYYDDAEQHWGILFHIGYLVFNKKSID